MPSKALKEKGLALSLSGRYSAVMPRRPRLHLDGVLLHIVQRGHNREPCFFGEEDYSPV
jgi:hypothetical protein